MRQEQSSIVFLLAMVGGGLLLGNACVVNTDVGPKSFVSCVADAECPSGAFCNLERNLCVKQGSDTSIPLVVGQPAQNRVYLSTGQRASVDVVLSETVFRAELRTVDGRYRFDVADEDAVESVERSFILSTANDTQDGQFPLEIFLEDNAGNSSTTLLDIELLVDLSVPVLTQSSVELDLSAPVGSVLTEVSAARDGAGFSADLVANEILMPGASACLGDPCTFFFETVLVTDASLRLEGELGGELADGEYSEVFVSFEDVAGNSVTQALPLSPSLTVDNSAPDEADVEKLTHRRVPWGDRSGGPRALLLAEDGAVEDDAWMVIYGDEFGDERLAQTQSNEQGGLSSPQQFAIEDRDKIYVKVVDGAANESNLLRVTLVEYVASLYKKVAGDSSANPNRLVGVPNFGGIAFSVDATEYSGPQSAADLGEALRVRGTGSWRNPYFGSAPTPRFGATMAYDYGREEMLLFGGVAESGVCDNSPTGSGQCAGLFRRRSGQWSQIQPADPEADGNPDGGAGWEMSYDEGRGVMVLYDGGVVVWEWNGQSFKRVSPSDLEGDGNPARSGGFALSFDWSTGETLLFGGRNTLDCPNFGFCDETWSFDGQRWLNRTGDGPRPFARSEGRLAHDPERGRVYLLTGFYDVGASAGQPCLDGSVSFDFGHCYYQDLWAWDGTGWEQRCEGTPAEDVCGTLPFRLSKAGVAFNREEGALVLSSGEMRPNTATNFCANGSTKVNSQCRFRELWEWSPSTSLWSKADFTALGSTEAASRRSDAAFAEDPWAGGVASFGGVFNLPSAPEYHWYWVWKKGAYVVDPVAMSAQPTIRTDFALAYDSWNKATVLYGGTDQNDSCPSGGEYACDDFWVWENSSVGGLVSDWDDLGPPTRDSGMFDLGPREGHAIAFDEVLKDFVVSGGEFTEGFCDVFDSSYCFVSHTVNAIDDGAYSNSFNTGQILPGRRDHISVYRDDTPQEGVLVFGGRQGSVYRNDVWRFLTSSHEWIQECDSPSCDESKPIGRSQHVGVYDSIRDMMVVHGGDAGSGADCGDGERYCAGTWTYDGNLWERFADTDPEGDGNPGPRLNAAMFFDDRRGVSVLYGGYYQRPDSTIGACPGGGGFSNASGRCNYYDVWEFDGQSWARLTPSDPEKDGGPLLSTTPAAAYHAARGYGLLVQSGETWFWEGDSDRRAGQGFFVPMRSSNWSDAANIEDIDVRWSAGGRGNTASPGCTEVLGAKLMIRSAGAWKTLATNGSAPNAPEDIAWRLSEVGATDLNIDRQVLTTGDEEAIILGLSPIEANGCGGRSEVGTGDVSLSIRYRDL